MNKFIILCAFYVFNIYSRKQRLWMLWEYLLDTQLLLRYKLYNECSFSKYQKPSEVLLLEAPYWKWSAASSLFLSTCILIYEFLKGKTVSNNRKHSTTVLNYTLGGVRETVSVNTEIGPQDEIKCWCVNYYPFALLQGKF